VGGLERLMDDADKIAPYRVQIDGPAQSRGERAHDCLGIVACPVMRESIDGQTG
jgi:hypothetical protein